MRTSPRRRHLLLLVAFPGCGLAWRSAYGSAATRTAGGEAARRVTLRMRAHTTASRRAREFHHLEMGVQRLPPDKGDRDEVPASASFQPKIFPKNLRKSISTQQIQSSQAAPRVLARDCSQNPCLNCVIHPHSSRLVASDWGSLLIGELAPASSPAPVPAGPRGLPRHVAREHRRSSRLSPEAQPFFPGKASRARFNNRSSNNLFPEGSPESSPRGRRSYRDALLSEAKVSVPGIDLATLVTVDPKQSRHQGRGPDTKLRALAPVLPPAAATTADADEGWQVVGPQRRRARHCVLAPSARPSSPRYLAATAGKCFNCLSSSHKVASCRLPTRCFNCHGLGHQLRDCKRPRKPPALKAPSGAVASAVVAGGRVVRARCYVSRNSYVSQSPRDTASPCFSHLGASKSCRSEGSPHVCRTRTANLGLRAPEQNRAHDKDMACSRPLVLEASLMELQLHREPLGAIQLRSWDPMVEEAALEESGNTRRAGKCREEVRSVAEQLAKEPLEVNVGSGSTPSPTAASPQVANNHPPIEDMQTPLMFRSEGEQQIGHELIKALSNFKQSMIAPLSPSTRQHMSLEKKAIVVHPEVNQSNSRQRVTKSQKPIFRVVRDTLTKKWIFVKEVKGVGDWTLRRFIYACKKTASASRIETIRNQTEAIMLMKAVRKLTQASQKGKKQKMII